MLISDNVLHTLKLCKLWLDEGRLQITGFDASHYGSFKIAVDAGLDGLRVIWQTFRKKSARSQIFQIHTPVNF